ncbi:hypothetical protein niasHT_008593 [Heterodera trifolii]|uniref:Uncharacterized protein n=1 Tax=Heterodera trifolii TaxID=157864 RepID=A0ABD2M3G1_9BILA
MKIRSYICSSKWVCLCCLHVTTASLIVAWIYLMGGIIIFLSAIASAFHSFSILHILNLISSILMLCGNVPIIVGEMRGKRTSKMYRPFLITTVITAIIGIIATIIFFTETGFHEFGFYYLLWAYFMAVIVSIWYYSIVYRAYKFVQQNEEEKNGGQYGQNANAKVI